LYILIPLFACIACSVMSTLVLLRNPQESTNRNAALLLGSGALWAACEVVYNTRPDAETALIFVKASSLGWIWVGPLSVRLLLDITVLPVPRLRRIAPILTALPIGFVAMNWFTPWLVVSVEPTAWGFAYTLGPALAPYYAFALACLGISLWLGYLGYLNTGERDQASWIAGGIAFALVVASVTDGLLPFLGINSPRFGSAAFSIFGFTVAWSVHRFGYSLLAPGTFADEVLETLPDGVALARLDGRIRTINNAMARLLGRESGELVGVEIEALISGLGPVSDTDRTEIECRLLRADGDEVPVAVSSSVLHDRQGTPNGTVVVVRDLRELEALRGSLVVSGRLAAVGELAAGIAHEINNPLAYVRANLGLLRQHWDALSSELTKAGDGTPMDDVIAEGEEMIDESLQGVDRASAIVRDVRGLAHAGRGQREVADINALLDGVLRIAAPQLRDTVRIEKNYGALPLVSCASQELQQVFLNLIINAKQAMSAFGTIWIRTEVEHQSVAVTVEDDGGGICESVMERIFDPFFTTKPVGEGTGLGLGIALEIVRRHHGEISVDSSQGVGTTFRVRIPIHTDTIA
jgi:PAS domain S-box-containing protein